MSIDQTQRMPASAALACAATVLLVTAILADTLDASFGFDPVNLAVAFPVGVAAMIVLAGLTHDILYSGPGPLLGPSRVATSSLLATCGALVLGVVGLDHLHHAPDVDGWLAVAGGLLMLAASAADLRAGRRAGRTRMYEHRSGPL